MNAISLVVSCDAVPLNKINDDIFTYLSLSILTLGQSNPTVSPYQLLPRLSTQTIRSQIIEMVIDSGSVNSFHFLDICLMIPSTNGLTQGQPIVMPFNYKTCLMESNTTVNIQREVAAVIIDLKSKGINVTSITSDNIPMQILAFASWSKNSYLRSDLFDNKDIKRVIHSPCASHMINLIAKAIVEGNPPEFKNLYLKIVKDLILL